MAGLMMCPVDTVDGMCVHAMCTYPVDTVDGVCVCM